MADLVEQAEAREAEARACFTTHDLDGSNTINAAELATVLTTLGVKKEGVSDDDFKTLVDATLKEHDTNADGVLQFEEFVVMYNAVCLAGAAPAADVPAPAVFKFGSGLRDCVATNPESYKIVAECPNARLVEMRVPPGGEDQPHDHPAHSMFFAKAAKLSITDYGSDGKPAGEPHVVEIPAGASPIFPAGAHQVKNIGDEEALVLFVEQYPLCMPCGDVPDFVSPFTCAPECYKILAENDEWVTGLMEMTPGQSDPLHHHKDHLIYVLEGDELTIYPDGNMEDPHAVPIKPEVGIPAPFAAGPIFNHHIVKNSGTVTCKLLFFEMKK